MAQFLGLSLLDWGVIAAFFAGMLVVGLRAQRRVHDTQGFFQANRSFGRWFVTFLNFGSMTDAGQTAGVTREVFRQGLQGVWFQNLVLFHTPFQWFIAALQRRARYLAPGDMYMHRYESRFLAGLYATVLLATALYANASGYLLTGKTLQAMMVKPATEYSVSDRQMLADFALLKELRAHDPASLTPAQSGQLATLKDREANGELQSFVSYLNLDVFYIAYVVLIAGYTVLGGLFAVAIIDIVQGILIVFLSLALIPMALAKIGGLAGLHAAVPAHMFDLFGSSAGSDYTWYFVAAFALLNLVANAPKSFTLGGAAKDDKAARIGFVSGAVFKRFMMIGWAFTGLLAVALYSGKLSDPTNVWGYMTRDLLGAGAVGLMIAAIFSANMDGNATISLEASAAALKNVLLPLRPATTERRQMLIGRIMVGLILVLSIPLAQRSSDIVAIFKYTVSIGAIVGPAFWLAYFWRRVNTRAVAAQMILSIGLTIVLPNVLPTINAVTHNPALTIQTRAGAVTAPAVATTADVAEGRAQRAGDTIVKTEQIPPKGIFFETVAHERSGDTTSPFVGKGLFRVQIWLMSMCGVDFRTWSGAGISTAAMLFDAFMPFILLIVISLFTRKNSEHILQDFYARIHTPAKADPEQDAAAVQEKINNPQLVEQDKIFPGTNLEFWKPTRFDILGLVACILFVFLIIGLYMLLGKLV